MMARLGDAPILHPQVEATDTTYGRYVEIGHGTRLAHVTMGDYSYTDRYADLANVSVGRFANIAAFARIGATDHPLTTASLHHFLYRSPDYWDDAEVDEAWMAHRRSRRAHIGHDTWIGAAAQVRPGVVLGNGAVVGANAVVTQDVAPYTIVAGVPARVLRLRFAPAIGDRMTALAWWDWDHAALRVALPDFRALSAEAFLDRYEGA